MKRHAPRLRLPVGHEVLDGAGDAAVVGSSDHPELGCQRCIRREVAAAAGTVERIAHGDLSGRVAEVGRAASERGGIGRQGGSGSAL